MKKLIILLFVILIMLPKDTIAATEIIVMDNDSGRILYEKNSEEKRLIASITKIMTAIISIENYKLDEKIEVSDEVLRSYGTNIYIEPKEVITVKDLLYGLLLRSGNDASIALANNKKMTEKKFVELMNEKAKEIGMTNTIFQNPHGLDEETKNYSTAKDMAILSKYANKNKIYNSISKTKKYSTQTNKKSYEWFNRNKLLSTYKYCTGGKNGFTPKAGKTLVSTATKDDLNLTIVTLNDPNIYETHESLYNYYFEKYKNYKIIDKNKFDIDNSLFNQEVYIDKTFIYPLTEEEKNNVTTKIISMNNKNISGVIQIYLDEKEIGTVNILPKKQEKKELSFFNKFKNLII